MFNKKLYITIITIISILILSISCGNSMTDSTNGGNGENNGGSISGGGTNSGGSRYIFLRQIIFYLYLKMTQKE